ncbi:MAG TPA: diphosphomevalonate decarboxylase [Gammaproteobacteria bacterium]|nr:diphosphomevalonate decarboxylase [Gammaproteobacteria bacterium]
MKETVVIAHPNFALVKYWGKKDSNQNRPAMSSISVTVDSMISKTKIFKNFKSNHHQLFINGIEEYDLSKILPPLEYLSEFSGTDEYLVIESQNNFPTSSGLASSASGIASFVTAYEAHYNLCLDINHKVEASMLGSGSAPRSLIGGFVLMDHKNDYRCSQILKEPEWPLDVLICIASKEPKEISSREGMEISKKTSPIYQDWLDVNDKHINLALNAIKNKDMAGLENVTEENCKLMHEVMKTSIPSISYMTEVTYRCLSEIENLRSLGHKLFYTIDAGPQVKIICDPTSSEIIKNRIIETTDVIDIIHAGIGGPPKILNES